MNELTAGDQTKKKEKEVGSSGKKTIESLLGERSNPVRRAHIQEAVPKLSQNSIIAPICQTQSYLNRMTYRCASTVAK